MAQQFWHLSRKGKQWGPVAHDELLQQVARGEIGPDDLVWRPGFAQWTPASSISGLLRPPDPPSLVAITKRTWISISLVFAGVLFLFGGLLYALPTILPMLAERKTSKDISAVAVEVPDPGAKAASTEKVKLAQDAHEAGKADADQIELGADHIELDELIKLYMLPAGVSYTLGWETGSEPGTPISWEHAGIKDCDDFHERKFGTGGCRTGNVVITVNGQPTHTVLERTVEPGRWTITLMGPRAGITYISLESNLGEQLPLEEVVSKADGGIEITSLKDCGSLSDGSELLRVASSGKQPIFIQSTRSCGAALCTGWYVLAHHEKYAEALHANACGPHGD